MFRLNEFKAIAKWLDKYLPSPLAFFLKGWLYELETQYIATKASAAVEKGIANFVPSKEMYETYVKTPKYHSEPSEVEGLDIIQISLPQDDA